MAGIAAAGGAQIRILGARAMGAAGQSESVRKQSAPRLSTPAGSAPAAQAIVSGRGLGWLGWRAMAALTGGLVLRLWMQHAFPQASGDALLYGNVAANLAQHGRFAITDGSGVAHPTLIRLPGYPLFLALCFRLFGIANYNAVAYVQIALELGACLLLAGFVRRIWSARAGLNTLWLAALCPFTAVYASAPLTESLTFDAICLALWSLERCLRKTEDKSATGWGSLLALTVAFSGAAMLRPDGALVAVALWPALILDRRRGTPAFRAVKRAAVCALLSILPFLPWTVRNWRVFHVFEPLAPRYANNPGEDPHLGWQSWVKTWCLDFASTDQIYWNVPDGAISFDDLPSRAFDSAGQREETRRLFAEYSANQEVTPALDARFAALARQRTADHPLRTWLWLPLGRLADMTLRPRVENLTIDLKWWQYNQHRPETRFCVAYAALNLLLLALGVGGLLLRPRLWPWMTAYLALRCLLLLTIEAPETRYTLEFFPAIFAAGGIALARMFSSRKRAVAGLAGRVG